MGDRQFQGFTRISTTTFELDIALFWSSVPFWPIDGIKLRTRLWSRYLRVFCESTASRLKVFARDGMGNVASSSSIR